MAIQLWPTGQSWLARVDVWPELTEPAAFHSYLKARLTQPARAVIGCEKIGTGAGRDVIFSKMRQGSPEPVPISSQLRIGRPDYIMALQVLAARGTSADLFRVD
jgi:hypothetical protein